MISAITPVMNTNTYSVQQNHKHNNQQQNFGALQAQFNPGGKISRSADILLDKFLYHFENVAKKIGLDTQKLEQKGYNLCLDSTKKEDMDLGILNGVLKNKNGETVKGNGKYIDCTIFDCAEDKAAQSFANTLIQLNLTA